MRPLWNTVSFLAVVNLLALVMVLVWMWQSGRLTRERVGDIRAMLSTTTRQAQDTAVRLATEAEIDRLRQQEELARAHPAADSAAQIGQIALVHQEQQAAGRRLEDERRMLDAQLEQTTARMEANADALQKQRATWQQDISDIAQRKEDAQFVQVTKQFEQIPPKQAKMMIEALVQRKQTDQAVAYLAAMNPRAAAKVLREFKTDADVALATELLERLRTRGLEARSAATTPTVPPSPVPPPQSRQASAQEPSNAAAGSGSSTKPSPGAEAPAAAGAQP